MDKEKVLNLAKLARIEVSDTEAEDLVREFDSILKYVGEIGEVASPPATPQISGEPEGVRNVMREDGEPHESGIHTESLLAVAPAREGNYIRVKKIL